MRKVRPTREDAETLAVGLLGFLAEDDERLGRFLSVTGLGPATLRQAARDAGFLVSLLDYALADEPLLLDFAASRGLRPERVAEARALLEGPGR